MRAYTKVEVINDAYSQMRISGLTVDPRPEDLEVALDRLEVMMAEWDVRNICCNYNFEDEPDPNSDTNVNIAFKQALATNLAIRLIPDFNKQVPPTLFAQATQSLSTLSGHSARQIIQGVPYPQRQAVGSGNSLRYNRWQRFYRMSTPYVGCDVTELYLGDVTDVTERYSAYLNTDDNEIISAVEYVADSGIVLSNQSNTDNDVSYRVTAQSGNGGQVTVIVTTSTGRIETRVKLFKFMQRPNGSNS